MCISTILHICRFWGEWHTYPYNDWFPTAETVDRILTAFLNAFNETMLTIRNPDYLTAEMKGLDANTGAQLGFGFHDDSFAYSTLSDSVSWFFWPEIEAAGMDQQWRWNAQGGEIS